VEGIAAPAFLRHDRGLHPGRQRRPSLADAQRLGEATRASGSDCHATRRVIHDIRGGGLTILLGSAGILELMPGDESLLRTCADAARDHAKIMRNLLPDLDPDVRAADETAKPHGIGHFVEKWDEVTLRDGTVQVQIRCTFDGTISARCLALQRNPDPSWSALLRAGIR